MLTRVHVLPLWRLELSSVASYIRLDAFEGVEGARLLGKVVNDLRVVMDFGALLCAMHR